MNRIKLTFILALIFNLSCSDLKPELTKSLSDFSKILENSNPEELKKITTDNGYKSLMKWSDSLKNDRFSKLLSDNLKDGGLGVFNKKETDSTIILSLGKSDVIVGATNGYLILKKTKNGLKIDEFRGGK
tara:strand:+ start:65 stop:454 length:390 start_codon:yes stop_codon:yes gene_type:complete